jgi:hypothetical protein
MILGDADFLKYGDFSLSGWRSSIIHRIRVDQLFGIPKELNTRVSIFVYIIYTCQLLCKSQRQPGGSLNGNLLILYVLLSNRVFVRRHT